MRPNPIADQIPSQIPSQIPGQIPGQIIVFFISFIILFIAFFCRNSAFAQNSDSEPVGKVVAIRGKAIAVDTQSKKRILRIKAPIYLYDTVKTTQGRIQIIFKDQTIVTLGRKTEMKITRYIWQPGNPDSAMETQINEGSFRIMGGSITRTAPQNFKTYTPSGTIGIRGSMYAGLINRNSVKVIYQGGMGVFFQNKAGLVDLDRPGFFTEVKGMNQAPTKPKKAGPKLLQELDNSFAFLPESTSQNPPENPKPLLPEDTEPENTLPAIITSVTDTLSPIDTFPDISSAIGNSITSSTQTMLSTDIEPTDTERKILQALLDLGFTGTQSTSIPSTGVWEYKGKLKNDLIDESLGNIKFLVNWSNGRIIAIEGDNEPQNNNTEFGLGFGFGSITSTGGIGNIIILGSDGRYDTNDIYALTGSGTFGHFYGTNQDALGIAMEGYDINLRDSSDQVFWKDISAAIVASKNTDSYTGQHIWKGFFIGVAEDMDNINTGRRVFTNTFVDDFTLTIEKSNGTLSGSLTGSDFNYGGNTISALTIGGTIFEPEKSVYINDLTMGARISGSTAITINSNNGGIKDHGNFMVTSDEPQLSGYTTWGYWETAFSEPGTGKNYHIHVPGAFWIAGEPTPSTQISSKLGTSFQGTYTGTAKGIMINSDGITNLTNGTTNLLIDFDAAAQITGSISFTGHTLPVTSTSNVIGTPGFTATIVGATSSNVSGTFYGPNLEGIGGNFSADMSGTQYHGIFAGDR